MTVQVVARDLILASRILEAAERTGVTCLRVDSPSDLQPSAGTDLVLVDWGDRQPGWGETLIAWRDRAPEPQPHLVLFGPHTDLVAHAEAKRLGIGPMWARSKLLAELPELLATTVRT